MNYCAECIKELKTKEVVFCTDCGMALCADCIKHHECEEQYADHHEAMPATVINTTVDLSVTYSFRSIPYLLVWEDG